MKLPAEKHPALFRGAAERTLGVLAPLALLAACGGSDLRTGAEAASVSEAERYGGTAVGGRAKNRT